ncbi:hypothetical protein GCM10022243_34560 [Saccharothrix violaceirubra]|uniref:Uncharacterized protein n=1 Tax=Saccharothrix violaceirubra TaxID=413306 RepID=A0A7W7T5U2_9PSEU|nr:hypothetical protein [Saccharothrix violaceirubra]MBB4966507.1 hypothetical protein [Saccharothrix violaceirubra]
MRATTLLDRRELVDVVRPVHPIASVYLGPDQGVPWSTRWPALVDRLRRAGASQATITDVEIAVPDAPDHAVAVFADGGHVPAVFSTPGRTGPDVAWFRAPAHVLPLVAYAQERPAHVLVIAGPDRARLRIVPGGLDADAVGVRMSCPTSDLAEACRTALAQSGARLLVVHGDLDTADRLRADLPGEATVRRVPGSRPVDVGDILRSTAWLWTARSLTDLAKPPHGGSVQGVARTIAALARGHVRELVVSPLERNAAAWFGGAPSQILPAEETTPTPWSRRRGDAVDVAVRAALLAGATVRVVGHRTPGAPAEGIGALCRFPLALVGA